MADKPDEGQYGWAPVLNDYLLEQETLLTTQTARPAGIIRATADMTLTNNVAAKIVMNTTTMARGVTADLANSRLTIQTDGLYLISSHVTIATTATVGYSTSEVRINGVASQPSLLRTNHANVANIWAFLTVSAPWPLLAGDYLELWALQASGVSVTVPGGNPAVLTAVRLSD